MKQTIQFLLLFAAIPSGFALGMESRPNVIIILADDMGYADIEPFGNTQVRTPNLNHFAAAGA